MVADSPPTRENPSLSCGFSHSRPGGAGHAWHNPELSGWRWEAPVGSGRQCEYVPK
jgi:hypothetical protein